MVCKGCPAKAKCSLCGKQLCKVEDYMFCVVEEERITPNNGHPYLCKECKDGSTMPKVP